MKKRAAILGALALCLTALGLAGCDPTPKQPHIVLLVIDTLRADHLSFYGYDRPTSPILQAELADRGIVFETAYAEAPWTLPSMSALHTGHPASDLTDAAGSPVGIPDAASTLAERLAEAGYETAAFVANPTMHRGNGFAQGFETFDVAAPELSSLTDLHAADLKAQLQAFLDARSKRDEKRPLFLWLHYLDPHDPYVNDDLVDGHSPFLPDYDGPLRGTDIHGLEMDQVPFDPERDQEQLRALYDAEIRHVDQAVGHAFTLLKRNFGDDFFARSLVALTSDHGEELFDHGGFKHGQTLYQEQLHVPLVLRWDGRLPETRVAGPARLLDLFPTFLVAAGLDRPQDLEGLDLLSESADDSRLTDRQIFVRHLGLGPERAPLVRQGGKRILFDRHAPEPPGLNGRAAILWRQDAARLQRDESYRLDDDPGEQNDLSGQDADLPTSSDLICALDPWLDGLRILRTPGEAELTVDLTFGGQACRRPGAITVQRLFLAAEDEVEVDGCRVRLRLGGDSVAKGVVLAGALGPPESLRANSTTPFEPPSLEGGLRQFLRDGCPLSGESGALEVWLRPRRAPFGDVERDDETIRRLKALNYL